MADANIRAVITAEDKASSVVKGFSSQLQNLAQVAGGLFSAGKLLDFGKQFVGAFNESESALAELNAVLASTQNIAGVTSQEAIALSKSLQQVTTFSDETVLHAESMALTFTNLGKDIFPVATEAILNMATIMHSDVQNAAIQLGKALNDPADRIGALTRIGVNFNKQQIEMVQQLQATGRGMEAQRFILKELGTEFGGQARAQAATFGGQLKLLQNNLNDVEESIGKVLAEALRPLILGINDFVTHNGQFITSLAIAGLAAGGFAAAVIALAGAVAIAMTVLGPFTLILVAIAALVGVTVFKAVDSFQKKMSQTTQGFVDGSKAIASNGANNFGTAGKAASDLAQKLADIDAQMVKTTRDFREQLAGMVQSHQQKVADLKKQIDDETQNFEKAQDNQVRSHDQKVRELENQIKDLQITGSKADQQKINDLRVTLAQENEAYQRDTDNAQKQQQIKLNDFQTKLDAELAFLKKHGDDLAAVQDVQLLDEIDKLKRSHQEQMVEFDKQKTAAIKSASDTTAGMAASFNGLPGQINGDLLAGVGTQLGSNMAQALKDSFKDAVKNVPQDIANWGGSLASWLGKNAGNLVLNPLKAITGIGTPQFRAAGGPVSEGSPYIVGEQGPELFVPSSGGSIVPSGGGAVTVNLNAQAFMGTPAEARKFAVLISKYLKDAAGMKSMTVSEMLS